MLSKRVIAIARGRALSSRANAAALSRAWTLANSQTRVAKFHSSKLLQAETVKVPQMAESISEGTLKTWHKQPGDSVQADEEIATIETDKIDVSVNAPAAGTITELLANEEDTVSVGQDLFRFEPGEGGAAPAKSEGVPDTQESKPAKETEDKSEPKDQQVEKGTPPPPPPAKEDVRKPEPGGVQGGEAKKDLKETSKPAPKEKESEVAPPRVAGARTETRVKMSRMRQRIAERLKESQNAAASLTTFNEIDMSSLIDFRKKYKEEVLKTHEVKLGFMSAFAKACCIALKEIPAANASIEGDEIVYRDYVDLSVAVATPKGLVTPVVRNAETMNFVEIEKEIARLGKKARDGKLTLEDMAGGTFTISNGGVFGSLYGTPIINLPQSAVLGMHAIKEKPVVVDGQIVIRPIMVVALTYDHRLLDGREAVTFLVKVRDYLEDPRRMLLA
ncbi:dihydrolipoamide succinyltransferase [Panus rudis PR-1116 ss-1]|nr:dihydrolipoamide succinyltransferase [Panus rudis PR-1116 ss-1]